jgi:hypothetical protein
MLQLAPRVSGYWEVAQKRISESFHRSFFAKVKSLSLHRRFVIA